MAHNLINQSLLVIAASFWGTPSFALETLKTELNIEVGAVWQSRNDVQIPTDSGTYFEFDKLGKGPFPHIRFEGRGRWQDSVHGFRLILAPLELKVSGTIDQDIRYNGKVFSKNTSTEVLYKFNSYRLGYVYHHDVGDHHRIRLGSTLKIRDASIELRQASQKTAYSNVGVVPLLYGGYRWHLTHSLAIDADMDFAWAPQGRAFDFACKLVYETATEESLALGIRSLEGGAANDRITGWAWLNYIVLSYTTSTL